MPLVASTGPVLARCWQHRPSTGPVLARNGMFTGFILLDVLFFVQTDMTFKYKGRAAT